MAGSNLRSIQDLVLDDVVAAIRHGRFVLAHAAMEGHEEVLRYLLHRVTRSSNSSVVGSSSSGVDPSPFPNQPELVEELSGAFLDAADQGHAHCLSALLEACTPIISINDLTKAKTDDGYTALMLASICGSSSCVKMLLQHSPEAQVAAKADDGATALLLASEYGRAECVDLLLQHSPATQVLAVPRQLTPLMMAAQGGHGECVRLLLQHSPEAQVAAADCDGDTALLMAAGNGHADCVSQLLRHAQHMRMLQHRTPGDRLLTFPVSMDAALMAGVRNDHQDCVAALLAHTPALQIAARDADGRSALELAARLGHPWCLDPLLAHDPQPQHLDAAWLVALQQWSSDHAPTSPHTQCLERLAAKGALLPRSTLAAAVEAKARLFIQDITSRALVADRANEAVVGLALAVRGKKRKAGQGGEQ